MPFSYLLPPGRSQMSITPRLYNRTIPFPTLTNVGYHHTGHHRAVERFQQVIREQVDVGRAGLQELAPNLLDLVADIRNLRTSWDYLAKEGGDAPGPNGLTYRALSTGELIEMLQQLQELILAGEYRPGPSRTVKISKLSGNGTRTLTLQDIQDRVVARACVQILQPLLQPQLRQTERTASGHRQWLLAELEHQVLDEGRTLVSRNDIRDAFDHVPQNRFFQVLPRLITSPDLCSLVERCVRTDAGKGLRQGSPLSPLLLDVYLDHFLVRRWEQDSPDCPLLKYVDDILIPCRTRTEAEAAGERLIRILANCGLSTKTDAPSSVLDLADSSPVEWLGMSLQRTGDQLAITPTERCWGSLEASLIDVQRRPGSSLLANQVVQGWVNQLGPCYEVLNHLATYRRVRELAGVQGFDELRSREEFQRDWNAAYRNWQSLRAQVRRPGIGAQVVRDAADSACPF
jgi:retron-type reverse transcriptase